MAGARRGWLRALRLASLAALGWTLLSGLSLLAEAGHARAALHGFTWFVGLAGILHALRDHLHRSAATLGASRHQWETEAERLAARRLEAVGRLSSGVAHDFNNLLAPILSVSSLVRDELPPDSPLRADLDDIRGAALKARDLVRALQTFNRKNGVQPQRIDLAVVVAENEELLRRFAGSHLAFTPRVTKGVTEVVADRPLLELVLANLMVNAREGAVVGREVVMEAGAIALSEDEAARLQVRSGLHAAVTVAERSAARCSGTEGYAPVEATGAGSGMPALNGIVAQYGGVVVARAAPGLGWIVRLLLPAAPPPGAQET
jgi:signal transduction histidine kinase